MHRTCDMKYETPASPASRRVRLRVQRYSGRVRHDRVALIVNYWQEACPPKKRSRAQCAPRHTDTCTSPRTHGSHSQHTDAGTYAYRLPSRLVVAAAGHDATARMPAISIEHAGTGWSHHLLPTRTGVATQRLGLRGPEPTLTSTRSLAQAPASAGAVQSHLIMRRANAKFRDRPPLLHNR